MLFVICFGGIVVVCCRHGTLVNIISLLVGGRLQVFVWRPTGGGDEATVVLIAAPHVLLRGLSSHSYQTQCILPICTYNKYDLKVMAD